MSPVTGSRGPRGHGSVTSEGIGETIWAGLPLEIGMSPAAVSHGGPCQYEFITTVRGIGSLRAGDGGLCEQVFTRRTLAVNLVGEICPTQAAFSQAGIHTAHLVLNTLSYPSETSCTALPPATVPPYNNQTNNLSVAV